MPSVLPSCYDAQTIAGLLPWLTEQEQAELARLEQAPSTDAGADVPAEIARCASDIVYWLTTYGKTYDPRLLPADPNIPFVPYPKQAEFLQWLQAREAAQEDGLAEKSRDVGFTWLCGAYALHGWLFRKGFAAGFGSRKEELVDRLGDLDTIFEKIRLLRKSLPEWMLPAGFKESEHDNHLRMINPANGATITGEGGDNIGRGGRKTVYFIDEAAFLERPNKIEAALSQTTRCRIWVSTPNGPGNPFAKKRFSGKTKVFTFHWKDDPRKNRYQILNSAGEVVGEGHGHATDLPEGCRARYPWYEAEKDRIDDPVVMAQEVDIDYTASIEGICIPAAWVRAAVNFPLPDTVGRGELVAGLDVAEEGHNKTVLIPRQGPRVHAPHVFPPQNTTQTAWDVRDKAEALGLARVQYDADGPGTGVKGTWATSERKLTFETVPVHGGGTPTNARWPDGKTSAEKFFNLRSELWYRLRKRFERTYEVAAEGKSHPPEDLISIPDCPQLIAELSTPLLLSTDTGKYQLESKKAMAKRGVKSPDHADALAYSEMERMANYRPAVGAGRARPA